jgi:hypothetical protein
MGGIERRKEECRDKRRMAFADNVGRDLPARDCAKPRSVNTSENSTDVIAEKRMRGWPQHQRRQQERPFQ